MNFFRRGSICSRTGVFPGLIFIFFGQWADELGLELDTSGRGGFSEFHILGGSAMWMPFMTSREPQWIESYIGFKALCLPCKPNKDGRQFAMYVFLPDVQDGQLNLLGKFATESGFLERHLPKEMVPVGEFKVPIKCGVMVGKALAVACPSAAAAADQEEVGAVDSIDDPFQLYCFSRLI